jgi:hypothetical protein
VQLACVLVPGGVSAADSWSYEAAPFLWTAGLNGHIGLNNEPVDVSATFQDLVGFVDIGAAMRITARRAPIGWFGEASWVELTDGAVVSSGTLPLDTTHTLAEGGLSYDIEPTFAVYGGLRFQDVDSVVQFPDGRKEQRERWIDAMAGARWTPFISERWVTWARGDVGAGGSRLVWLAEAGGGYHWSERWSAYVAYRVLHTDYSHAGFTYDVQQSGLLIGFGFRFREPWLTPRPAG